MGHTVGIFRILFAGQAAGRLQNNSTLGRHLQDLGEGENEDSQGMGLFDPERLLRGGSRQIHGRCHWAVTYNGGVARRILGGDGLCDYGYRQVLRARRP